MIIFRNKGTLDPKAITTFGVSSKEGENNIGFFGTGLKYAIAILLREKCSVEIWTGGEHYTFKTVSESIRVDEFDTVYMGGGSGSRGYERLGFTTELGKKWELWQAYRELYSNCLDENGEVISVGNGCALELSPKDDETVVMVSGHTFDKVHSNRYGEILLPPSTALHSDVVGDVHPGNSSRVYYNGIRAYDIAKPGMYTYNIRMPMELSEDRSLKYEFRIRSCVGTMYGSLEDEAMLERVLTARDDTFESCIDYSYCPGLRDTVFEKVVKRLTRDKPLQVNASAMQMVGASKFDSLPEESQRSMLKGTNSKKLDTAIAFLKKIGYDVQRYDIIVVEHIEDGVMGLAHNNKIYITKLAFSMGLKQVTSTLLEEYVHLAHGLMDCTRELQNFLFDSLLTMAEENTGDVL